MHLFRSLLLRAALALAAACAPAVACAGAQYHVSLDTRALAGQSGYLDFLLLGLANATPATATLSNFSGNFGAAVFSSGDVLIDASAAVTLGNSQGWNEFGQWARLGGLFGFDIMFDLAAETGAGSVLSVALLDGDLGYLGSAGDILTFTLQPGQPVGLSLDGGLAAVSAVPEPSSAWLGGAGLLLIGATLRRRRRR